MQRRTAVRKALLREMVYREVSEAGCAAFSVLMERLHVKHNELSYVLDKLKEEGRVESIYLGRIALWCTNRAAAEEVLVALMEALKKVLCGRVKFATPKEALQLIAKDKEAQRLFSRHTTLRSNPTTVQVIDTLMQQAFGQPIRTSREHIYYVVCRKTA